MPKPLKEECLDDILKKTESTRLLLFYIDEKNNGDMAIRWQQHLMNDILLTGLINHLPEIIRKAQEDKNLLNSKQELRS